MLSSFFRNLFFTLAGFLIFAFQSQAQFKHPFNPERPVSDNYFGTMITDNYRWLEDLKNPEVQTWIKAQSDFSISYIERITGRDSLFKRLKAIQNMGGDQFGKIVKCKDTYYYAKTSKNEKLPKLYSKTILTDSETLLFDPEKFQNESQLVDFVVDRDGKMIAISLSHGGSESCAIRILDIKSRQLLPDVLGPAWSEFNFEFTRDGKALLYTRMNSVDNTSDDLLKNMQGILHRFGTDSTKDLVIASKLNCPNLNLLPESFPMVTFSDDYDYIFLMLGFTKTEITVFVAPYSDLAAGKINWTPLIKPEDQITEYELVGHKLFFLSHKNAPNHLIAVTDIQHPDFVNAQIVVAESSEVIRGIQHTKKYVYFSRGAGVSQDKYQIDPATLKLKKLELSGGRNGSAPLNGRENDDLLCVHTDWLTPEEIYEYNGQTGMLARSQRFEKKGIYPDYGKQYMVKEVEVPSYDGSLIPLSIIYPKDIKMDGSAPCLIVGYGAYGSSCLPGFMGPMTALLEQDVVIAIAHVRGGGEKGESWHRAGMKATKSNTWKDFIACAEYLEKEKYTSSNKLIGKGVSMGGVLIGRAITERPDLFAVAIVEVGETNTLRAETTPNGPNQIPEIGTVKNEEDCRYLIEMDAQSKVKKGEKYPAVIIRSGMNDPRVVPWMPAKFAAVLQNSSQSGKPVLLDVNFNNGHFTSDVDVANKDRADIYAFALWQVGHPKFVLKK